MRFMGVSMVLGGCVAMYSNNSESTAQVLQGRTIKCTRHFPSRAKMRDWVNTIRHVNDVNRD